ncbi:MAG: hypothetical protein ACAH59_02750 [Pseudobdellovibrionaceae bacterium]
MKSSILSLFFLLSFSAFADTSIRRNPLTDEQVAALPVSIRENLHLAAIDLSSIWADTILEGEFFADEKVQIDLIEKLYLSQAFIGYRITYSSRAWDTSSCRLEPHNPSSFEDCQEGRIIESGFVTKDFSESSRDPENFANFQLQ